MAEAATIGRLDFARQRRHGAARLRILQEAQDSGGYNRVIVISESWHVGQFRDRASGRLTETLLVDIVGEPDVDDPEKTLTDDMMQTADGVDIMYESGEIKRFAFDEKTPPDSLEARWVCNLRANFGDTSEVV